MQKTLFLLILLLAGCAPGGTVTPTPAAATILVPESAPILSLTYDPALTGAAEAGLVSSVALSADQPVSAAHPAHVEIRFPEFARGRAFQPPYPIERAQLIAYRTQDFAGYASEASVDYPRQFERLQALLEQGVDPARCAEPIASDQQALPLLPLVHAAQVFCAKPQIVSFDGGQGVRYVTYYAQDVSPALDWQAFYTFQGLTEDGQVYLSAILPIQTNILPAELPDPGAMPDVHQLQTQLREQIARINAQPDDAFTPDLGALDALIAGISIPAKGPQ